MSYLTENSRTAFYLATFIKCFFIAVVSICVFVTIISHFEEKALSVRNNTFRCTSSLRHLYEAITYDRDVFTNVRISDLIQEALRKGYLNEKECCCTKDGRPYLVFSVDASVLSLSEGPRIPIIMDHPDSHMEDAFLMRIFRVMNLESGELVLCQA